MIILVQLELLLCGLHGLPSIKKWIYRRQKRETTQAGIIPSISLTVNADVHSTLTGSAPLMSLSSDKTMGCQFPTGNVMILGKQVLGGQGCKTALQAPPQPMLWAILLEGDAAFVLPSHKYDSFSWGW